MATSLSTSTSPSLLDRVRQRDGDAWSRLARLYTPLVYRWARQSGLQANDAADIAQEVFLAVASHIEGFDHDRDGATFRGWLWTITRNKVRLHFRRKAGRPDARGGTDAHRFLHDQAEPVDAPADGGDSEPGGFDAQRSLVHRALELVRQDFQPQTWQAFLRFAMAGQSAVEIAAELGMTPAAVRQAKYRVLSRLHDELERL
jgi:RNA polymerase sigma-70 factor (ECF subfamily)